MDTKATQLQGGKEIGLFELKKYSHAGYSIPEFFVLPDLKDEEELRKIAEHFKGSDIIVRSNSIMENKEFGFDGIYKTVVVEKCNLEKLKEASQKVFESLFSEDAIAYRNKAGIVKDSMRVIVQRFIGYKEASVYEELRYFVMETSVNSQGDISVVVGTKHDFINNGMEYEEIILSKDGKMLTSTSNFGFLGKSKLVGRLKKIGLGLQKVFGPVSLEGAYVESRKIRDDVKVFLFQRRLLEKEFYQAQPEIVPDKYQDRDILFRSTSYRGAGKIENLPIVIMPTIDSVSGWENELRRKISQLKSDVIMFVATMALGKISSRILNDYTALAGVRAIVSFEKIDFLSHAFKVASLARIPFVSVESFSRVETLSRGSLFFTTNQAVFCLDEKREEFRFDLIKKSEAESLATLAKKKGVVVEFSEEKQELGFGLDLKRFSFDEFEVSFHRLLEDVSGEVWLLRRANTHSLGFGYENSKGQVVDFSGWANYLQKEGHLNLDNFREHFENNKVEWGLIQRIVTQLNG